MRRTKTFLKVAGVFTALVLVLFTGIILYVHKNSEGVFSYVSAQLADRIGGNLSVRKAVPDFFHDFPHVSLDMRDVTVRDSMWESHRHDLLHVRHVYVSFNIVSLISGKPQIRSILVDSGTVYLYTDTAGYSNTYLFRGQQDDTGSKSNKPLPQIANIGFRQVSVTIDNKEKLKFFQFGIRRMDAAMAEDTSGWVADVQLTAKVHNMMFHTGRGSFLKDKMLRTRLKVHYEREVQIITVLPCRLMLDNDMVEAGATFLMRDKPVSFILDIRAPGIRYKNALSLLSFPITSKIEKFDFKDAIDVQALVKGHVAYRDTPYITVAWQVKENTLLTPAGPVTHCSFAGLFNNERVAGAGYKDDNAVIELKGLRGTWQHIPFRADTVSITNISKPVLQGRFTSHFDISSLNAITGRTAFRFDGGQADVNVLYKGGVFGADTTQPYLYGYMQVRDAGFTYLPRGLGFSHSNATLRFHDSELYIDNVRLQRGTTVLHMEGRLLNFLNLYYTAPEKILWDLKLSGQAVNLNDFVPVLMPRKAAGITDDSTALGRFISRIGTFLDAGIVRMKVDIDSISYKHFAGHNLRGDLLMEGADIALENLSLHHAGGKLRLNARMRQEEQRSTYRLKAMADHVNVQQFFTAFENFGQSTITDRNVAGILTTNVAVSGSVMADGHLMPHTIDGTADFRLERGSLVNFEPFRRIGGLIFRRRRPDSIWFRDIDGRFTIRGDKIEIHPMFIESSAFNMHVKGIYAIGPVGTDIDIDLPLRNPRRDEYLPDIEERKARSMRGVVLHLKAVSDEHGKTKIKWNSKPAEERRETRKRRRFQRR